MTTFRPDERFVSYAAMIAAGFAVGVSVGVLWAPKAGWKTRADLRRAAGRQMDDLRDRVDDLTDSARALVDRGKERAAEIRERVQANTERVRVMSRG